MTYGFIGLGNMARAIIGGMRRSDAFRDAVILGAEPDAARAAEIAGAFGVRVVSAGDVMAQAQTVVLAVKPQVLPGLLPTLAVGARQGTLIVSIAAGKDTAFYEGYFPVGTPIVRVMPNINAMVGYAAVAVTGGRYATAEHIAAVRAVFDTVGETFAIAEELFSAFTALSGSSVAFAYRYIDVIARAAVEEGFEPETALAVSCAAALGSAKMAAESGIDPATLVKMVCSPGGTTIEGIRTLDAEGFDAALTNAFRAVVRRDRELRG